MARWSRSAPGPGPFRRRFGGRSTTATGAAASPPDGELRFRRPDGQLLPEVPPPAAIPADPVQALRARHEAQGLCLDARTATPGWLGEPLNVGWAIDVLHPLARCARSTTTP